MGVDEYGSVTRSAQLKTFSIIGFTVLAFLVKFPFFADLPQGWAKPAKKIPDLTADGQPNIRSRAAFVVDSAANTVIYAKKPDEVREIASTGKIFVAMVVLAAGLDLNSRTLITRTDQLAASGGARSRLAEGMAFTNREIMAAMLIGSDNRAATALGRAVGLSPTQLVARMNALAVALGLQKTTFSDPSGLSGNFSTAREMAIALKAALANPTLAAFLATKRFEVDLPQPIRRQTKIIYYNTNQLLHSEPEVVGGKTGFTSTAGYCLLVATRPLDAGEFEKGSNKFSNHLKAHQLRQPGLTVVFLGADGKKTRFADYRRLRKWLNRPE